jgi:hypothetical protein
VFQYMKNYIKVHTGPFYFYHRCLKANCQTVSLEKLPGYIFRSSDIKMKRYRQKVLAQKIVPDGKNSTEKAEGGSIGQADFFRSS